MMDEKRFILLIDIGSTYTKVVGVDLLNVTILGSAKAHTTVSENVCIGLNEAITSLHTVILANNNKDVVQEFKRCGWQSKLACSSAAGGLRMVAIGLVESLTSKAAKEATLSAGAKILKTYSGELSVEEIAEIQTLQPDILLLSGGTDGGNKKVVIKNCAKLGKAKIKAPIVYAGNKSATGVIHTLADKLQMDIRFTDNVMPKLNELSISGAKATIAELFIEQIIQAKGISEATSIIDDVLMPTPLAVINGAKLLAEGLEDEEGFGDILVVDIGGATTDIHSVCDGIAPENNVFFKGLKEPYVKRSVEGDLGARYSIEHTIEAYGEEAFLKVIDITKEELDNIKQMIRKQPDIIAVKGSCLQQIDQTLAEFMVKEAVRRHAGKLIETYTPMGKCYEQTGKDLRKVKAIIGTGGPVIHSEKPRAILEAAIDHQGDETLLVPNECKYYLDDRYILSSMGLLAKIEPKKALKLLKSHVRRT